MEKIGIPDQRRRARNGKTHEGKRIYSLGVALLAGSILLLCAILSAGCGSEAVPEYRARVTEILSGLKNSHGEGNPGGEEAHPDPGHDAGHGPENGTATDLESLRKAIVELEEVRVPAGWEEFHRNLLGALSSLVPEYHGDEHAAEESPEHALEHGEEGGETGLPAAHTEEEPKAEEHAPAEHPQSDHPSPSSGH
ncbi:MAG: hypothetical protein WHT46_02730 [Candidatus Geothermincolales bacterium]